MDLGVLHEVSDSHFSELKKAPLRRVLAGDCKFNMPSVLKGDKEICSHQNHSLVNNGNLSYCHNS